MNIISDYKKISANISIWMFDYASNNNIKAFVVGVSGGIDSAVSSTLATSTGLPTYAIGIPIHQKQEQETLSDIHLKWLQSNFSNVIANKFDLTKDNNAYFIKI